MNTSETAIRITEELKETLSAVDNHRAELLVRQIAGSNRIFLAGAGRSLLMVKCFAMRLIQFGLTAFVVGETTTPSITADDLLIVVSGSGETGTIALMAKKAKSIGAKLAFITIVPDSTIGRLADLIIPIEAGSTKVAGEQKKTIQLGGSRFELSVLLLLEAIVMGLTEVLKLEDPNVILMKNHANLE